MSIAHFQRVNRTKNKDSEKKGNIQIKKKIFNKFLTSYRSCDEKCGISIGLRNFLANI